MVKPDSHRKTNKLANPIITALKKWRDTNSCQGLILDNQIPFFTPDGQFHQLDAGWTVELGYKQQVQSHDEIYTPFCPSFAVRITTAQPDLFKQDEAELINLRDQGCKLGWLVEPESEWVYILQPGYQIHQIPTFDYYLDGRDVLQGFEFPLRNLRY